MSITRLGIVGAGTMGSGIAIASAARGVEVVLFDVSAEQLERAREKAARFFARAVEKKRMAPEAAEEAKARIRTGRDLSDLADRELVIEAVFEDFDLKARLFRELSEILPEETLVATNTSCLRVSDLQRHIRNPGRFLGLHYFSPAEVNPVVEVVAGEATAPETMKLALLFVEATGKLAIRCRDSRGFAINRFFCPYTNEAARLLDEGLGTTAEIDAVAKRVLGAAAGPFFVMNIIKPRINLHAIRNLEPLGPFYAPARAMVEHGEADRPFETGEAGAIPEKRERTIGERLLGATFLPVLQELDEEVAEPAAIDLGAREALKFSRPPCALMDELGRGEVEGLITPFLERYGIARPRSLGRVGRLLA